MVLRVTSRGGLSNAMSGSNGGCSLSDEAGSCELKRQSLELVASGCVCVYFLPGLGLISMVLKGGFRWFLVVVVGCQGDGFLACDLGHLVEVLVLVWCQFCCWFG